jgi:hypothetical protein
MASIPIPSRLVTDSATEGAREERSAVLLVALASLPQASLETTLANLSHAFAGLRVLVATPDLAVPGASNIYSGAPNSTFGDKFANLHLLSDAPAVPSSGAWVLTAADFVNLFKLAQQHDATACLLLGAESQSLAPEALQALAATVLGGTSGVGADLAVPRYDIGPREGLVNSAILYPISRALYGARPRFPLAIDLGLSLRMAERMAVCAQKFTATGQNDALVWPVSEAAVAGYAIQEVNAGTRIAPQPTVGDLNAVLGYIAASLFTDVEARAAFWQRTRVAQAAPRTPPQQALTEETAANLDVQPMLDAFRLAYTNLQEIWSLVLPPQSLLGLKRLAASEPGSFRMADALWARIVYDFLLAFRLRTLNRGHLLGALTPLYLGWVASHILLTQSSVQPEEHGVQPEDHIEQLARAFEFDKPYFVSRWRWPDRFNP